MESFEDALFGSISVGLGYLSFQLIIFYHLGSLM
jgi:hypothetical protein